ncbi:MAG: cell division protein SepF [Selenomonas sp.]|jgi:cell division inhibitor SepF|uniref:cell division protein SepF n=1 Tax=Selenomonas sp. AE3005 TaxID=1485543 RepID=UPI0004820510|nr:cell division protein SepF [Selenomonas sp. AE3005]MBQ1615399.1 cell division protein SepF [Selenomonas sp.]MBQ1919538.1 cell division protein SepF [Selenomonas sp.]MBQ2086581.1 cell division protein SepF [Selenomonas sp.]MBQ4212448.1 cell division protein SepF [Selenomonas sp.]MBQ5419903.1 cell division protein SepF [Selenomonas sp.]
MSIIDKVCGKMGLMDPVDDKLDKYDKYDKYEEDLGTEESDLREEEEERFDMSHERNDSARNVVDFQSAASARENGTVTNMKMKVIVIEPKTFDDAQQVANNLREKKPVVINFEKTEAEDAKRIIDFISGTTYALNGEIKKVGHNVFLCAPSNVNVSYTEEERKVSTEMPWLNK